MKFALQDLHKASPDNSLWEPVPGWPFVDLRTGIEIFDNFPAGQQLPGYAVQVSSGQWDLSARFANLRSGLGSDSPFDINGPQSWL